MKSILFAMNLFFLSAQNIAGRKDSL